MPYKYAEDAKEQKRQWHSKNPGYSTNHSRNNPKWYREAAWRKAGIDMTWERFLRLYADQEALCALCYRAISISANVDHDHETGRIRGLICGPCNKGLGCFNDNVEALQRAIDYLKNSR